MRWRRTVVEIKAFPFFTGGRQEGLPEGRQKAEQKPNKSRTKAEQRPKWPWRRPNRPNKGRTKAEQRPNKGRTKAEQRPKWPRRRPRRPNKGRTAAKTRPGAIFNRFGSHFGPPGTPQNLLKLLKTKAKSRCSPFSKGAQRDAPKAPKSAPRRRPRRPNKGRTKAEQKPNKGRTKAEQSPRELQKHPKSRQEAILERCLQQPRARHARRASRKRCGDDF